MSEPSAVPMPGPRLAAPPGTPEHGPALSARAAPLASAVADVLDQDCTPESGAPEVAAFLRTWAAQAHDAAAGNADPLDRLATRFALTGTEVALLLLAGLPEEHEGLARTFRALHPSGDPHPTAGLAVLALDASGSGAPGRDGLRATLRTGTAVRTGLLTLTGGGPLFERGLAPAPALWDALRGVDAWPPSLTPVRTEATPGLDGWLGTPAVLRVGDALRRDESCTVEVRGPDETVRLSRAVAVAAHAGSGVVAARVAPGDVAAVALLAAHAAVRDALPVAVVADLDTTVATGDDVPGPLLHCGPPGTLRAGTDRPLLTLPDGPVEFADRRDAWRAALPELAGHASALAARYPLDPSLTPALARDVRARTGRAGPSRTGTDAAEEQAALTELTAAVRDRGAAALPVGVALSSPDVPLSRLVVPPDVERLLRDAVDRLELQALVLDDWDLHRRARAARGVRLLFSGPPGTGKSLAAEAVATAAGTDLLMLDASQIVSKWIGETEKNLGAAFDVAERTRAVLFVDEADALFGARTEISDARDRYANLETAYLLQRLDRFDGLVVLATNLRGNVDAAFTRRMDAVVEFPMPDRAGRAALWALHLPDDVRASDVDADELARLYPISGGWIRNAAVAAAFRAARAGTGVGQDELVGAVCREYAKGAVPFPGDPRRRSQEAR